MKRFWALVFVFVILFSTSVFAADTTRIGGIATVTGNFAAYGAAEMESVKMAANETNAACGVLDKKLELVMYDCRARSEDMVSAARRLVQQDKVTAVIGPSGSGLRIAASPVFNQGKIPRPGTPPTNPKVTVYEKGKVKPYNFRIYFLDPYQEKMPAIFAARDIKAKTAAILYDIASDYSHGPREFFKTNVAADGGKIIADEGLRGEDVDFRAQLTRIKLANLDVIVFPIMEKCLPPAVKQAREMGMTPPVLGGGDGGFIWEIAGNEATKNIFWVSHVDKAAPLPADFFAKYRKQTGTECQEFTNTVMAYDRVY